MYESLSHFLRTFSVESPFLWALTVMVVVAAAGLTLHGFWELALRGLGPIFVGDSRDQGGGSGHGGH